MLDGAELGAEMRRAQERSGLSVAAIAKACGVTTSAVYSWFKTGRISKPNLVRLSEMTGVSFRGWLEESVSPRAPQERLLLDIFREMDVPKQNALLSVALSMIGAPRHIQEASPEELTLALRMEELPKGERSAQVHHGRMLQGAVHPATDREDHRATATQGTGGRRGRAGKKGHKKG